MERCVLCHRPTRMWWGNGCAPLCERCAGNASYTLMVKISRREHLGPIPQNEETPPGARPSGAPRG